MLAICSKNSIKIFKLVLDFSILDNLKELLPQLEDIKNHTFSSESFPHAIETVNFLDSLLPEREETLADESQLPRLQLTLNKKEMLQSPNS